MAITGKAEEQALNHLGNCHFLWRGAHHRSQCGSVVAF